jgi:hypothetical protein
MCIVLPYCNGRSAHNVSSRFDDCYAAVRKVIKLYEMDRPVELSTTTFYALSYYVDRAGDVKLIGKIYDKCCTT